MPSTKRHESRPKKKDRMVLDLAADLGRKVRDAAKAGDRSLKAEVERRLRQSFEREQ